MHFSSQGLIVQGVVSGCHCFMLTWFQDRFTPEPNEPLLIVVRPGGKIQFWVIARKRIEYLFCVGKITQKL